MVDISFVEKFPERRSARNAEENARAREHGRHEEGLASVRAAGDEERVRHRGEAWPRSKPLKRTSPSSRVDAIVNAANTSLLGGGGVDGAIHRAAGPELLAECRHARRMRDRRARRSRAATGCPAKYRDSHGRAGLARRNAGEPELLASCYRTSLALAVENGVRSIAFPAISCGVYGYPIEAATEIAVREVSDFLHRDDSIDRVVFACFGDDVFRAYERTLACTLPR